MTTVLSHVPRQLFAGFRMLAVMTVLLGVVFPALIWGIGQVAFSGRANGSQVQDGAGRTVGSELLAQKFAGAQWFHPRPSAGDYDTLASGGSNLGPDSAKLTAQITERRTAIAADDSVPGAPVAPSDVPADAVTASFSGLDPDISPAYARQQAARVARARGLSAERVRALVDAHVQGRQWGYLGEPRVNVVTLNLALQNQH